MRNLNLNRISVLFCAFALFLSVAFFLARCGRQRVVTLPDGLSIEFLGVTVGTNRLPHGTPLQRIFANHIPPQGLKLGPWYLAAPNFLNGSYDADACAWLVVRGPNLLSRGFNYYWDGSEVVTSNRFGRQISIPTAQPFSPDTNEVVLRIPLVAFPRNDRTVILRFSPPTERGSSPLWIEFPFRNPLFTDGSAWPSQRAPITNRFEGQDFILSYAGGGHLVFTLPSKGWEIPYCRLFDNEGNSAHWPSTEGPIHVKNTVMFNQMLETNRPWRVEATFARKIGLRADTSPSPEQLRTVHVSITQPAIVTNNNGEVFTLRLDSMGLLIQSPDRLGFPSWTILSAKDENAQPIDLRHSRSWMYSRPGSGSLIQVAHLMRSCSSLDLQLACSPSFTAQFYIMPQP